MKKRDGLLQALLALGIGRSQREVAEMIDISESYWSLIRDGHRPITEELCARVIERIPALAALAYDARQEIVSERWQRIRDASRL